jgi:large subunit ribosomal protein L14
MITRGTLIKASDNTGAKYVKCVGLFGGTNHRYATTGHVVRVCLKKLDRKKKLKKKMMYLGLLIGVKNKLRRVDGSYIKCGTNRIVLISGQNKFMGTNIYGPLSKEIRLLKKNANFKSLLSYSAGRI